MPSLNNLIYLDFHKDLLIGMTAAMNDLWSLPLIMSWKEFLFGFPTLKIDQAKTILNCLRSAMK